MLKTILPSSLWNTRVELNERGINAYDFLHDVILLDRKRMREEDFLFQAMKLYFKDESLTINDMIMICFLHEIAHRQQWQNGDLNLSQYKQQTNALNFLFELDHVSMTIKYWATVDMETKAQAQAYKWFLAYKQLKKGEITWQGQIASFIINAVMIFNAEHATDILKPNRLTDFRL